MEFTLTYDLDEAGWAYLDIEDDGGKINITISYLRDSLREMATVAKELVEGAESARVVFLDEPGETRLVLNRKDDVLSYEVQGGDDWGDRELKVLMSGKTTPTRFVSEVKKELQSLYEEYGEALYVQRCIHYKFPTDLLQVLTRMDEINKTVENINTYEEEVGDISESDTQVLLVEKVLGIAGYDVFDPFVVRRASRSSTRPEFDVEVYRDGKLFLAIEVKAISSQEFNIDQQEIGQIQIKNGQWKNKAKDGVGQLRAYCCNWKNKLTEETIPILTNGERWCLFFPKEFVDEKNASDSFKIEECAIIGSVEDCDFDEMIIKRIRCLN